MAIVTQDQACLFVDGRYHVSAGKEIDSNWSLYKVGLDGVPTWSKHLEVRSYSYLGGQRQLMVGRLTLDRACQAVPELA